MKKIICLIVAISLAGCSKILEENPNGQLIGAEAITTLTGLQAAVNGVYQPLKNGFGSGFSSAALNAVVMGSDDLTTNAGSNKQELREMDQFSVNSTNGRLSTIWLGCYRSIKNANNVIVNYKNVTGDQAKINQLVGEAYFLRAFSYYWLVRLWGNIPLIQSADYNKELLNVSKSSPAQVYQLIESDLKLAEVMMPNAKPSLGRANAGTAKALLAEVYLTQGGYPIKDASKYALAAAKAKEVIDNKALYGFDLVPDLATLWSGTATANGTKEGVFELTFCAACGNGNSVYGNSSMPDPEEAGWGDYFSEITFFNNFPAGKRKDVTFHTVFKNGTIWQNSASKHPYYKKFRVNTPSPGVLTFNSDQSIHMLRYASVLLTYAEAQARSTGVPSLEAYAAVNAIRSRAGLGDLVALTATDFANAVVQERAWEFAGEYTRWFDLVRLEMVESANAQKHADDLKPIGTITKANYWLPIPYSEILINPNLK